MPWLAIAPTEMVRSDDPAREGRADHPVADLRLDLLRLGAAPGRERGDLGVVAGAGGEAAILERFDAGELLLRLARPRLGLGQLGVLLGLAEHGDHLAGADEGAVVEVEPHDPLGYRRGERHLLVGPGIADRFDPVGEVASCVAASALTSGGAAVAALLAGAAAAGREAARK